MNRHNRARDLALLLLVLVVGLLALSLVVQQDRRDVHLRALVEQSERQTQMLGELLRHAEARATGTSEQSAAPAVSATLASDAWAREGVAVVRPAAWAAVNDPRVQPGYVAGGTMTEAVEAAPGRLTPYLQPDSISQRIVNETVCESLAQYDMATLELRGWLAEAWQVDPAGLWLRVKIRDEAVWSDGAPVRAQDVRYTFMDYVKNPRVQADAFRAAMNDLADVIVVSEKVAEFRFGAASFNIEALALRNPILPSHVYGAWGAERIASSTGLLVGSGPWRLERVDINEQWAAPAPVELVRNERYWGTVPPVERMRFVAVTDAAARLAAVQKGDADLARGTPEQVLSLRESAEARASGLAWTNMRSGHAFIAWNVRGRPDGEALFADARTRRALTMMLDREKLNADLYGGLARVSRGPFPPSQADSAIAPLPFDAAGAAALLREAGWIDRDGDGVLENARGVAFAFELLYVPGGVLGERLALEVKDRAEELGIKVTVRATDAAALGAARKSRGFDACILSLNWSGPESDPFGMYHSSQIATGENWIGYSSPRADELIDRARAELRTKERAALWRELHGVLAEDQPVTFLLEVPWIRLVGARLGNVHAYPGTLDRREFFVKSATP